MQLTSFQRKLVQLARIKSTLVFEAENLAIKYAKTKDVMDLAHASIPLKKGAPPAKCPQNHPAPIAEMSSKISRITTAIKALDVISREYQTLENAATQISQAIKGIQVFKDTKPGGGVQPKHHTQSVEALLSIKRQHEERCSQAITRIDTIKQSLPDVFELQKV